MWKHKKKAADAHWAKSNLLYPRVHFGLCKSLCDQFLGSIMLLTKRTVQITRRHCSFGLYRNIKLSQGARLRTHFSKHTVVFDCFSSSKTEDCPAFPCDTLNMGTIHKLCHASRGRGVHQALLVTKRFAVPVLAELLCFNLADFSDLSWMQPCLGWPC